jgi:hypothetical protein
MSTALARLALAPATRARVDASLRRSVGHRDDARPHRRPRLIRRASSASPSASASNADGMYDGTVLFHLYDELVAPKPIFTTFLEGALHVAEVARSHPSYASAHFHEAHDQARAIDCEPHGYFNMTLFSCAPETLWDAFEDLRECVDIGHVERTHHPLPCAEIAAAPGPTSAIASGAF